MFELPKEIHLNVFMGQRHGYNTRIDCNESGLIDFFKNGRLKTKEVL